MTSKNVCSTVLLSLQVAAASVADGMVRYQGANVVVTVTSRVGLRPSCHGMKAKPSSRSDLVDPNTPRSLSELDPALHIVPDHLFSEVVALG